jgi:hypothetical protein
MRTPYLITLEGTLPVIARIRIDADNEWEAGILAERIAESQKADVKTPALEIQAYPADWFVVENIAEVTPIDPDEAGGKVWNREEIEELLGTTGGQSEPTDSLLWNSTRNSRDDAL